MWDASGMASFRLDKWYFDCVAADGAILIGYAARLKWGPIGLCYGARITMGADGPLLQRHALSLGQVGEEASGVTWTNDSLGVAGQWTGGQRFEPKVLFDASAGSIEWQCLGADCDVSARVDGHSMRGRGYTERLSMTVPPWSLPFRELRWGRYIGEDGRDYAVWIDLREGLRRNWICVNSSTPVEGTVDDAGVRAHGSELVFEASRSIRNENVARTLLGRLQFLSRVLPRGVRSIQENKQLSSCVLSVDGSKSKGFAINEVVQWL